MVTGDIASRLPATKDWGGAHLPAMFQEWRHHLPRPSRRARAGQSAISFAAFLAVIFHNERTLFHN